MEIPKLAALREGICLASWPLPHLATALALPPLPGLARIWGGRLHSVKSNMQTIPSGLGKDRRMQMNRQGTIYAAVIMHGLSSKHDSCYNEQLPRPTNSSESRSTTGLAVTTSAHLRGHKISGTPCLPVNLQPACCRFALGVPLIVDHALATLFKCRACRS